VSRARGVKSEKRYEFRKWEGRWHRREIGTRKWFTLRTEVIPAESVSTRADRGFVQNQAQWEWLDE